MRKTYSLFVALVTLLALGSTTQAQQVGDADLFTGGETVESTSTFGNAAFLDDRIVDGSANVGSHVFSDGDTTQAYSISGIVAPTGIDTLRFFDEPEFSERIATDVTIYYDAGNVTSLSPGDYSTNLGLFNLGAIDGASDPNAADYFSVSTNGLQKSNPFGGGNSARRISYADLGGLGIPAGTQSILLDFSPSASATNQGAGLTEIQAFATPQIQSVSSPIAGSGWNEDLVVEASTPFTFGDAANAVTTDVAGWNFYERGWNPSPASPSNLGLSSDGTYIGASGAEFDIEPYDSNNAILNAGTFTLDSPASFSELTFLVTTQDDSGQPTEWTATVNFSDSTSTILAGSGADWTQAVPDSVVVSNHGLVGIGGNTFYNGNLFITENLFSVSAGDQLKTVTSIDFGKLSGSRVVFHAISGQTEIPEPTALMLCSLGLAACGLRRRR